MAQVPDVSRLKSGEVNLGTSIMAVTFNGGVVLGADSRTTMGSYIANRVTDKLTHIHDRIYCCRSGSAADTQAVADIVTYYAQLFTSMHDATAPTVHTVAHMFSNMVYQNKDALSAGIIVAGWDKQAGPCVYNIPLGGGLFKADWAIGGSGSSYIYGYCDSTWQPGWGQEQTIDFVRNALALAMSRDGSSGGTIRMVVITEDGVERIFVPGNELPTFNGGAIGASELRQDLKQSGEMEYRTSISTPKPASLSTPASTAAAAS